MPHQIKNIAVTGAQGFIGTQFVQFMAQNFKNLSIHAQGAVNSFEKLENVKTFTGRLGERNLPVGFLKGRDIVFHFAFHGFPSETPETPEREVIANLNATGELLEKMREEKVRKLVILGTGGAIYSKKYPENQTENTPTECRTAYAAGKLCTELFAELNHHLYGLETYQLRVSNVYGPGQNVRSQNGFIAKALDCILHSTTMPLWVDLSTCKDFIFTEDLFLALEKFLLPKNIPSGIYNLGSHKSIALKEVISIIEKVTTIRLKTEFKKAQSVLSNSTELDCSKFSLVTGWSPRTDLYAGIAKYWEWYRQNHSPVRNAA